MMSKEAMKRISDNLKKTGATLPAPEITGTIEGSMITGLCIALAIVEQEIEALAEQPAQQERTDYAVHLSHCNIGECEGVCKYLDDDCPALKHADMKAKWDSPSPQPAQQEPVGTVKAKREGGTFVHWTKLPVAGMTLYTSPPQRTWVGLTDEEHITDGSRCWCNPDLDYKDPDTGAEVWIHKEPQ